LLAHTDVLQAHEEGLHEQELEEPSLTHTNKQSLNPLKPPKNKQKNQTTCKGKDKRPPMERHLPDPLKQTRQKQAKDAKLLAAQTRQREGIRKEQDKIRAREAAEKHANKERRNTPPPLKDITAKYTLPTQASQNKETDPEILPEAGQLTKKQITPEGDVAEVSQDYTLSEEGEGDNISGKKELRDEAQHEDENNSKRPKVPLHPDIAE
jgi:hypothetical protein